MTTTLQRARAERPELPTGEILIDPPPRLADADGGGALTSIVPMLGSLGSVVLVTTSGSSTHGASVRGFVAAALVLASSLGFGVLQLDRQRQRQARSLAAGRTTYLRHLDAVRVRARDAAARQHTALHWQHPCPAALPLLVEERSRTWERGPADEAFLQVRFGVCARPLSVELVPPDPMPDRVDPAAASALRRLLAVHRVQPDLPATVDLRIVPRIEVCGPTDPARSLARAIICSAVAFHPPDQLGVAVLASPDTLAEWDWLKWLPHALSARCSDAAGPRRMVSTTVADLATVLPAVTHLLLVVDGTKPPEDDASPLSAREGRTVLALTSRPGGLDDSVLRLLVDDDAVRADRCDLATAEAMARRLTPLRAGAPRSDDLVQLLGLGEVGRLDPRRAWWERPARDALRVPIGTGDEGEPVHLDLKESAQQGMGPHGLVIGATGSGKSELLRTLVLALALSHSPERLNLVLVDFKGGATFAAMGRLPHVSATITNLEHELSLVDRMHDALSGEMLRRQRLLRDAGNCASARDYEQRRDAGEALPPLPSLLVVVDEFTELLAAKPELVDLFVTVGRLGRSLGLHLLLAAQRLEEGRLRGLESHLSYRIGLRTFSAQESRTVLGVPDAYDLPPTPGLGFLKADQRLVRFTAAYVSGPASGTSALPDARSQARQPAGIWPWTIAEVPAPPTPETPSEPLLDVVVDRMAGLGPPAHQIWLPPLEAPDTLGALMPDLAVDPGAGLVSPHWRALGGLTVPLGTVDRPRDQRRDILTVDLAGAAGHVAVVGGPRSGKTTLLRTLVTSLALTTTPLETAFFVLDLAGGGLGALRSLPHVAGVATRTEQDVVRRVVAEVTGLVDRREAYFDAHGIDSIQAYRSRLAAGGPGDDYGEVFLVVDGWSTVREIPDLEVELQQLASRGLTFGCHLLTSATRWADFRPATRDLIGTRLELRLGDPLDSEIDRRLATLVPPGRPGRGVVTGPFHFLSALPRIDGDPAVDTLGDGVEGLVTRVRDAWPGPEGPRLRLLPDLLTADDLASARAGLPDDRRLLLGVEERRLVPTGLDPDTEPHWLVFGDGGSGRSGALRQYLHEVVRTRTPKQAQLVVVDYRRSLLGEVPDEHLLSYLTSAAQAGPALAELASYLEGRLPGPGVTAEQLRLRSWWSGADVFVVVDDYDLVATGGVSPVQPLQPLLAQARDAGLHLAVARRSGGASRALFEPVIQSLRDLATPGLVLSGSPEEGALVGNVRPAPGAPGRGRLVSRDRGVEVVQLAWREPVR